MLSVRSNSRNKNTENTLVKPAPQNVIIYCLFNFVYNALMGYFKENSYKGKSSIDHCKQILKI